MCTSRWYFLVIQLVNQQLFKCNAVILLIYLLPSQWWLPKETWKSDCDFQVSAYIKYQWMFMTEILFCVFHNDRSWSWKLNNKLQLDREDVLKKKQTGKKDRAGRRENKIKNRAMGQTNESIRNYVETQFCSMSRWDLSYAFFFQVNLTFYDTVSKNQFKSALGSLQQYR